MLDESQMNEEPIETDEHSDEEVWDLNETEVDFILKSIDELLPQIKSELLKEILSDTCDSITDLLTCQEYWEEVDRRDAEGSLEETDEINDEIEDESEEFIDDESDDQIEDDQSYNQAA